MLKSLQKFPTQLQNVFKKKKKSLLYIYLTFPSSSSVSQFIHMLRSRKRQKSVKFELPTRKTCSLESSSRKFRILKKGVVHSNAAGYFIYCCKSTVVSVVNVTGNLTNFLGISDSKKHTNALFSFIFLFSPFIIPSSLSSTLSR